MATRDCRETMETPAARRDARGCAEEEAEEADNDAAATPPPVGGRPSAGVGVGHEPSPHLQDPSSRSPSSSSPATSTAFTQALGDSFARWGFAVISDHGLPQDKVDAAIDATKAFFALPEETKRKYKLPARRPARLHARSASRPPRARPTTT